MERPDRLSIRRCMGSVSLQNPSDLDGLRQAARFDSEQVAHEEVHAAPAGVWSLAYAVASSRHD